MQDHVRELDCARMLPIVVGAHPEAEANDRVVGYGLRRKVLDWQDATPDVQRLKPVVMTDLWYLNDDDLRGRPTITVGRPEINAATAWLAGRLPTALVVDAAYRIQLDPELIDLRACIWGRGPRETESGVMCFVARYLGDFLDRAHL